MTLIPAGPAPPPPNQLELAVETYGRALIGSMTNGMHVNVDVKQLTIDGSLALRLGEFIADEVAKLMSVPSHQLQDDFAKYLLKHATELANQTSRVAVVPAGSEKW